VKLQNIRNREDPESDQRGSKVIKQKCKNKERGIRMLSGFSSTPSVKPEQQRESRPSKSEFSKEFSSWNLMLSTYYVLGILRRA
jgi:hypothetical protein